MCLQAAQQGDATKVDKRRKKKQKEQAEDEAFLDNEQDDGEYEQGKSGQPSKICDCIGLSAGTVKPQ